MSRVLVVGINYAPEPIGTAKYTSDMCEWLAARGHAVRVLTAPPYYPEWKTWPGYRGLAFHREQRNGVDVIRCPIWVPARPQCVTRMLHLASFGLTSAGALAYSYNWRPDWVINVAPTLASAPGALALARMTNARCWLHVQDFEVDAAMHMGIVHVGRLRRLALTAEHAVLRQFDVVSTISSKMIERLARKGVKEERQVLLPNWADIEGITPLDQPSPFRAELGIPGDAVVALYSGNMGQKQGLELLGEAARQFVTDPNIYFVFAGEGPVRSLLEQACRNLPNVRFVNLQPIERLCDWLGLADIHLLPQRADVADLVMPSKLTGMLASGRPVLATAMAGTGIAEAVKDCGTVTAPGDTYAFVAALRKLAADRPLRQRLGRAAREKATVTLSRERILNNFEKCIAQWPCDDDVSHMPHLGSPTHQQDQT